MALLLFSYVPRSLDLYSHLDMEMFFSVKMESVRHKVFGKLMIFFIF